MKRGIWNFVLLICFLSVVNFAQPDTGGGKYEIQYDDPATYDNPETFNNPSFDPAQVPPDYISKIPPEKVGDPNKLQDPSKMTADQLAHQDNLAKTTDASKLNQQELSKATSQRTGETVQLDAGQQPTKMEFTASGFKADQLAALKINGNTLTNAKNIEFKKGALTASSADFLVSNSGRAIKATEITLAPPVLSVASADEVILDCARAQNVKDSTFTLGASIRIEAKQNVSYSIQDCANNRLQFTAKENAKLVLSKRTDRVIHNVENASIDLKNNGLTESIDTTGRVEFEIVDGIARATLTPISSYTINTKDGSGFSITTNQSSNVVYIKKTANDVLPDVCQSCTKVDLTTRTVDTDGPILFKVGNLIAYEGSAAFIELSSKLNEILDIKLTKPAFSRVSFNNYVWLEQLPTVHTPLPSAYHVFLGVNEKLAAKDITPPIIKRYTTAWSSRIATYDDSFVYGKEGAPVAEVLHPDKTSLLLKLLASLQIIGLPLVFLLKKQRKAQLTVFIILGLIMLGAVLLLVSMPTTTPKKAFVFDQESVQEQFSLCAQEKVRNAIHRVASHGGSLHASQPNIRNASLLFNEKVAWPIDAQMVSGQIQSGIAETISDCIAPESFNAILISSREPEIKVIVGEADITTTVNYPFTLKQGETEIAVQPVAFKWQVRLKQSISTINALTDSEHTGLIDIDAIQDGFKVTFFPDENILIASLQPPEAEGFESPIWFWGNRR